ncbi:487471f8-e452-41ad-880c-a518c2822e8c [Sclerotinia trifoliorum]|uniref:487471f8-e452-41ad-880c-a518c2822e8c n=1 Tax=Sclerotinia trifoliorum TaxID=28548 RepID=A0A8H2ZJP8_9HELO|nr:487471f8-e452-41ad-880c-a518c2822e8c [Sclerotinia trifoliorum]
MPDMLSSPIIPAAGNGLRISEIIADITQGAYPTYASFGVTHQPRTYKVQLINGVSWNVRYHKTEDICANELSGKRRFPASF